MGAGGMGQYSVEQVSNLKTGAGASRRRALAADNEKLFFIVTFAIMLGMALDAGNGVVFFVKLRR